ncbi:hypothetical protein OS493_033764 [Desmophyllum pertusum]|uniref:Uncharacterized protein n=1 Tax=Desmophyllum pertusum TaxID=174260 RepID=A0A9X0CW72_9CNID|nr:hypothetical protein OS493_033764 [Desmophyllum pertusum]
MEVLREETEAAKEITISQLADTSGERDRTKRMRPGLLASSSSWRSWAPKSLGGLWYINENMATEETRRVQRRATKSCPPGMWVCKMKRMLKQMLKSAVKK